MRHRQPGKVTDNLWYLGVEESGVYILQGGKETILINGGLSYILPDILEQMRVFRIAPENLTKILILHTHFDHIGVVPYFKRKYPHIEVIASDVAWQIFAMPKARTLMNTFSAMAAQQKGLAETIKDCDLEWREDITGSTVKEGDRIDLGDGLGLEIYETPGHSNCSISAYEPSIKALFASDAVGVPFKDILFPSMNTNVNQYLESLSKLTPLQVRYLCADHCGYITGEEAEGFVEATLVEGKKWKGILEDLLRTHNGDVDTAAKALLDRFFQTYPDYFIVPEIMEGVFKQMLKFILKSSGNSP